MVEFRIDGVWLNLRSGDFLYVLLFSLSGFLFCDLDLDLDLDLDEDRFAWLGLHSEVRGG